jgi:hypothetical protein
MNPNTEHYTDFVVGLVKQMRPKNVLEIGLGSDGHTAVKILPWIAIGNAARDPKEHGKLFIIELTPNPIALKSLENFDKNLYELRVGNSQHSQTYEGINDGINTCDLVLIDGDHSVGGVFKDIQECVFNNVLKPDGLFVFHDSGASNVRFGLLKASDEFNLEIFHMPALNLSIGKHKN